MMVDGRAPRFGSVIYTPQAISHPIGGDAPQGEESVHEIFRETIYMTNHFILWI